MNVSRLLLPAFAALALFSTSLAAPIDREALVRRHNVHVARVDPESTLSVGNGDFAFTVDVTGLQTFENLYHDEGVPLSTLSTWAWHSFPNTQHLTLDDAMVSYDFHGRKIRFAGKQKSPAGAYFRENPHPVPLGQISLMYQGRVVAPADLTAIDQTLDLWTGEVHSRYQLAGQPVEVETVADATQSTVAVRLRSPLVASGALSVRIRFAYSYESGGRNNPRLVWDQPDKHKTEIVAQTPRSARLERTLDATKYFVDLAWENAARLTQSAPHDYRLAADPHDGDTLAFTCDFSPNGTTSPESFATVDTSSRDGWHAYWTKGGVVDFSGSTDPRAAELERRVVLSQYLMRVNYGGHFPPSEDGLTNITWFGKHNSEMYYWHAAQFYTWGHVDLLERGLGWYRKILPLAKADAASQGFEGARWPKMAGIDGRPSPGSINPFIIWNEPNPIALCELVYRAHPDRATLESYRDVVFESANFLASFAQLDPVTHHYVLGPPIKNVSESSGENHTRNPTFELAYWSYGLQVAQQWRQRLGLAPDPHWADVLARLTPLPVNGGRYVEIETFPQMYDRPGMLPTSELMALGYMPKVGMVDLATMRRTFDAVNERNGIDHWNSWQLGQGALTATRLDEPEQAVHIITLATPTDRFMNSGYVRRPKEPKGCPAYLPVNSSLLLAVGTMAAGWDGGPSGPAPGFPRDGTWVVHAEGLNRMP
ncbi:MAG TPA: hypothetical protein VHE61_09065 [Opitutaceae bacterium]|nr:hypothetical protein [Opitutaceae bacterium]